MNVECHGGGWFGVMVIREFEDICSPHPCQNVLLGYGMELLGWKKKQLKNANLRSVQEI